ncbi:MAG: hypothetical protein EHM55_14910 [Acidobacteria bacterium]|nr:MAG: hypothetical protein EHM55_14910 [Acidobacteriota bacterium]
MASNSRFDFFLSRELAKERKRLLLERAELADESFQIAQCPDDTTLRLTHMRKLEEHVESLTLYYERAALLSAES